MPSSSVPATPTAAARKQALQDQVHAFGNERKAAQRSGRLLRFNPAETATVHLLAYQDTVDEYWVGQALAAFDPAKISYVEAASEGLAAPAVPAIG